MLDEKKIQRFWDEGIIAPVQRDTPLLLRSRNYSSNPPRLKAMVERFGKSHAGQALTQLPSRPYSYLVDMVMDNYAYAYAMSNRLLGYMQIKGVTSLRPTGPPILCPMKCKNANLRGGLHAVTCKKLGQHTRTHSALESLVLEMARDALAIPLSQQRAAVTLCDEKRREEPSNLFATIPVVPPSGTYRA